MQIFITFCEKKDSTDVLYIIHSLALALTLTLSLTLTLNHLANDLLQTAIICMHDLMCRGKAKLTTIHVAITSSLHIHK